MKKIFILICSLGLVLTACQKNDLDLHYTEVATSTDAQFRIMSVIPVSGTCDTLYVNDQNYFSSLSISAGGIEPFNSTSYAGRYFNTWIGTNTLKLNYQAKTTTPTAAKFVYSSGFDLPEGKWSVYVYNAARLPILLQDYDIPNNGIDTVCYIKFANFFYKADGVTPYGNLTLKLKHVGYTTWETVATNIPFGSQSSAYYKYYLKNTEAKAVWNGTEAAGVTLGLFDASGNQLTYYSSGTTSANYATTFSAFQTGRAFTIYLNGKQGTYSAVDQLIRMGYAYDR